MSAGRPPTTVEGKVRAAVRDLAPVNPAVRVIVMESLLRTATVDLHQVGRPSRDVLVRLAAHAIAWADEEVKT